MAHRLNLTAGTTVLDVGCGFGGPAKEIAKFVGCQVVGLNINAYQIEKGKEISLAQGIGEDVLELVQGDFLVREMGNEMRYQLMGRAENSVPR